MHPRAETLIRMLDLRPHPEGGFYRRVHQSALRVERSDDGVERRALTCIYYLLPQGVRSRWHRVMADEAWHHYEGGTVELLSFAPDGSKPSRQRLGPLHESTAPVWVVPATWWQAAHTLGDYSLVGCSVGPGFEFEDFTLLADLPEWDRPPVPALTDYPLFL